MRRSGKPNTSKCCDGQRKANYRIVPAEDLTPAPSGAMAAPSPDTSATNKKRLPMRKRGKVSDIELKHVPHARVEHALACSFVSSNPPSYLAQLWLSHIPRPQEFSS